MGFFDNVTTMEELTARHQEIIKQLKTEFTAKTKEIRSNAPQYKPVRIFNHKQVVPEELIETLFLQRSGGNNNSPILTIDLVNSSANY